MELAPVLISVYSRLSHFRQCIKALQQNELAQESDLYIVSDGPAQPEHAEAIQSVRKFVGNIEGFRSVTLIARESNWGSYRSIKECFTEMLDEHGKLIFMEDDIITAPSFLKIINEGLEFYKNDQRIFSVHGYCYPIEIPKSYKPDVFLAPGFNAWGIGLWKDRWEKVSFELEGFSEFLKDRKKVKAFLKNGPRVLDLLVNYKRAIDSIVCYHMFQNNMYSVYPVTTKTINIGHDGTGEHCHEEEIYSQQQIVSNGQIHFQKDLQPDKTLLKNLSSFLGYPGFFQRLVSKISKLGSRYSW